MHVLVLGGTAFVGRAIVTTALGEGMEVTLFSRGRTGPGLFPEAGRLVGDRDSGDYRSLAEGGWDAVVDVCGYVPRHVRQAMDALGERVGRYLFISSHAVYQNSEAAPGATEDVPRRPPISGTEALTAETYGPLKVACEDEVLTRFGGAATIVRPGKVAGPHDWQDGLTYWVRRAARGGRVAVPADPDQPVQVIDSRDLAQLVVRLLADERPGAFNAAGPETPTTLGGLITTCARVAGSDVELVRVPLHLAPPLFPLVRQNWASQQRSPARARAAGMPATPLEETVAAVRAWDQQRGEPPLSRGFSRAEEAAALAGARGQITGC